MSTGVQDPPEMLDVGRQRRSITARLVPGLGSALVSLATVLALWYLLIIAAHSNPLVTKNPIDVFRYLFTGAGAGSHLSTIGQQLKITLRDASVGYVVGTAVAVAVACLFVLVRSIEQTFMPMIMVMRTTPVVAMAPLLTLLFGRGLLTVTAICTMIVFFPTLVNMTFGLRSAPHEALDLMDSYGATRLMTLRKVRLPSSLPAFFASAHIAVPSAMIGALVAEWLATGNGMGYEMLISTTTFDYAGLWTSVVVLTVVTIAIYSLVGIVESLVVGRVNPVQKSTEGRAA